MLTVYIKPLYFFGINGENAFRRFKMEKEMMSLRVTPVVTLAAHVKLHPFHFVLTFFLF